MNRKRQNWGETTTPPNGCFVLCAKMTFLFTIHEQKKGEMYTKKERFRRPVLVAFPTRQSCDIMQITDLQTNDTIECANVQGVC